ncbi:hypothetical protein JQX13_17100 [Archangium violaceum]|uniref:hypothetical protein n=1 Tax=Archangium violaceum TaxID=83451 RepID=UPI00193BCB41|nr:hypothetical protein [Archangium violaceum]QRK11633.1 hypothetical protein JQX13_17100 [Archangium violaceum]
MEPLRDDEALEIIRRLQTGGYATEAETDEKYLRLNARYPGIVNLIFHDRRNPTAEQILAEVKNRKPILLGP